ncbi:hypothetical protein ACFLSY_05525 [Bacteroidota bacterium]
MFQKLNHKISKDERLNLLISVFNSISSLEDPSIDDIVYENFEEKQSESHALSLVRSSFIILKKDIIKDNEPNNNIIFDLINRYRDIEKQIKALHQPLSLKIKEIEENKKKFLVKAKKDYISPFYAPEDLFEKHPMPAAAADMPFDHFVYHDLRKFNYEIKKWKRRVFFIEACKSEVNSAIVNLENEIQPDFKKEFKEINKTNNKSSLRLKNYNKNKNKLPDVLKFLQKRLFIHEEVKADDFKRIFSGNPCEKKIHWIGNINELAQFFKSWEKSGYFPDVSRSFWPLVAKHFVDRKGNDIKHVNLRTAKPPDHLSISRLERTITFLS